MKPFAISFFCVLLAVVDIWGQRVSVSFPALAGREISLYYFSGAHVDSLPSVLDASGNARFLVPPGDYRGMITVAVPDAGGIDVVLAEPELELQCKTGQLDNETVDYPRSEENRYLKRIFTAQTRNVEKQAWLQSGEQFYEAFHPMTGMIQKENQAVEQAIDNLKKEIWQSSLYAARYYRLADFMNRLFDAEQTADREKARLIRNDMETALDIADLYRSGSLWQNVPNFYINMFNRTGGTDKHEEYARSILQTLSRLQPPYYETYLAGSIFETERFGWKDSQEIILEQVLADNPAMKPEIPLVQGAIRSFHARKEQIAPPVAGLIPAAASGSRMLVAFYDSDCTTCINEMQRLTGIYPDLEKQNIRVVSIAADMDRVRFERGCRDFPWRDKLCDLQGFEGENFVNFGVVGTPAFFLIDRVGKIAGRYFEASDLDFLR
jgi:hypothetical protein